MQNVERFPPTVRDAFNRLATDFGHDSKRCRTDVVLSRHRQDHQICYNRIQAPQLRLDSKQRLAKASIGVVLLLRLYFFPLMGASDVRAEPHMLGVA